MRVKNQFTLIKFFILFLLFAASNKVSCVFLTKKFSHFKCNTFSLCQLCLICFGVDLSSTNYRFIPSLVRFCIKHIDSKYTSTLEARKGEKVKMFSTFSFVFYVDHIKKMWRCWRCFTIEKWTIKLNGIRLNFVEISVEIPANHKKVLSMCMCLLSTFLFICT